MKQAKPVYAKLARRLNSLPDPQHAQLHLCLQIAVHHAAPLLEPAGGLEWLVRTANPAWIQPLEESIESWRRRNTASSEELFETIASIPGDPDQIVTTCLEHLLAAMPGTMRKRRGVYYTPLQLAEFLVRGAAQALTGPMRIAGGLAGLLEEINCHVLDPAAGAGVFLAATIRAVHRDFRSRLQGSTADWNRFVDATLLPALSGWDVMLAACAMSHFNIAIALHATAYSFAGTTVPRLQIRNALQPPARDNRLPIIVGNPPYSALTTNAGEWIGQLMKGQVEGRGGDASYYHVNGQPLKERKLWLHDDYVQFLRYAQYCVDLAGGGVTAFVTNRGFLDNLTFRGVRNALMQSYTSAHIVDLFPGGKSGRNAKSAVVEKDENLFDIDQGVAATVFAAPPGVTGFQLHYEKVTGSRQEKLLQLASNNPQDLTQTHDTSPPYYFFTPQRAADPFYQQAWPLDEIMPLHAPTIVTARDKLVTGFTREEVASRIREFCDLSIPDNIIRQKFFPRARSQRYPAGDTRGWKLSAARKALAAEHDHARKIRSCTYRAADQRYVYWDTSMIDWPRTDVSQLMLREGSMSFIARRQSPPGSSCNFFWAADNLAFDGVLRSDNRGGETFFPWHRPNDSRSNGLEDASLEMNLQADFRTAVEDTLQGEVAADEILQMIFALFHTPAYRKQFAQELRIGFPRVFIPATRNLFNQMAKIGGRLLQSITRNEATSETCSATLASKAVGCVLPSRMYPQWKGGKIFIEPELPIAVASRKAWEFRAGAHQICQKWLRDRRGRSLTAAMIQQYLNVIQTATEISDAMETLDQIIATAGGFESAFVGRLLVSK